MYLKLPMSSSSSYWLYLLGLDRDCDQSLWTNVLVFWVWDEQLLMVEKLDCLVPLIFVNSYERGLCSIGFWWSYCEIVSSIASLVNQFSFFVSSLHKHKVIRYQHIALKNHHNKQRWGWEAQCGKPFKLYENIASTKASASNGWRSPNPSPTPTNLTGMPSSSTTLTCNEMFRSNN